MRTLAEIETYLESATQGDYKASLDYTAKQAWFCDNATYARSLCFKMRNFGRKSWANLLWTFNLEESVSLKKI